MKHPCELSGKCGGILISIIALIGISAVELQGSSPIGYVDNIDSNGTVYGWAKDPDLPNTAIRVDVYADSALGVYCGSATAHWYHDSVAGNHGFTLTLPENIRSSPHSIYVWGIDASGDGNALIQNGNPFPTQLNVSSNDNSWLHTTGGSYQVGPSSSNIVGGRPNNKASALAARSLLSAAAWQGAGLSWFKEGYGQIRVTAAPRLAGAISSIMWDNVEFIDSGGHGATLQYIEHDNPPSELYNPTEAGSAADDAFAWYSQSIINLNPLSSSQNRPDPISGSHIYQHGSSSALQTLTNTGGMLHTIARMAFYIPKNPVPVYSSYPKPLNTIYSQNLCQINPPTPPGYNANDAFYSTYVLNQTATNATHAISAPDVLPSLYYEGTEPISDYTLDKTVTVGVANHPSLNNVLIFNTSITLPIGTSPHDFQLVTYPDHVRFRVDSASRTLTYDPATGVESDVTNSSSGVLSGAPLAVSGENRYAIAMYSRQANVGQYFVQDPHAQAGSHIALGVGTNGTLTAGTTVSLRSYVIVGTLTDVEASLTELYSINPPP